MSYYLLDTNVFIDIHRRHYNIDTSPEFWNWLIAQNDAGKLASIQDVKTELTEKEDAVSIWAKARGINFFLQRDEQVGNAYSRVVDWVRNNRDYEEAGIDAFFEKADPHLVAYGLAYRCVIVTYEKSENSPFRVKIPDVCSGLGVDCIKPLEMLEALEAPFRLQ